jgi:hypothetical protein
MTPAAPSTKPNLNLLSPRHRRVYQMIFVEKLSREEVAERLNYKPHTLKHALWTIRKRLNIQGSRLNTIRSSRAQIENLLLRHPETGSLMAITSPIETSDDGSFTFTVGTRHGKPLLRHTIKTEEL